MEDKISNDIKLALKEVELMRQGVLPKRNIHNVLKGTENIREVNLKDYQEYSLDCLKHVSDIPKFIKRWKHGLLPSILNNESESRTRTYRLLVSIHTDEDKEYYLVECMAYYTPKKFLNNKEYLMLSNTEVIFIEKVKPKN